MRIGLLVSVCAVTVLGCGGSPNGWDDIRRTALGPCGPVDPPVTVYRAATNTACFKTRWIWCAGDLVHAKHVIYERRTPVPGERVWCDGDDTAIDFWSFYIRPEDRRQQ